MAITVNGVTYARFNDGKYRPADYELGQNTPYFTVRSGRPQKDGSVSTSVTWSVPMEITTGTSTQVVVSSASMELRTPKRAPIAQTTSAAAGLTALLSAVSLQKLISGQALETSL